jgi:hypothetical protein
MSAFDLPAPDDTFQLLVEEVFGPESLIALAVAVALFAFAWWSAVASAAKFANRARVGLSSLDPDGRTRVARTSIVMVLAQSIYLFLSYFIAVELSVMLGLQPGVALPDYANWTKAPANAQWDGFVICWFVLAVLVVVIADYWASKGGTAIYLLCLWIPGLITGLVIVVAGLGAFMGYQNGDPQYPSSVVRTYPVVLGLLAVYLLAFHLTVTTPNKFFSAWRKSAVQLETEGS